MSSEEIKNGDVEYGRKEGTLTDDFSDYELVQYDVSALYGQMRSLQSAHDGGDIREGKVLC